MNKSKAKSLAYAAILLAVCICSQFFKNMSVYITGPIINACLILCTITAGLGYGLILSVITPVTSFIITGSPIMAAIPLIMPCVMVGNAVLVLCVHFLQNRPNRKVGFPLSMAVGSLLKGIFMGVVIALVIVPLMLPEKMMAMKTTIQTTFSITQFVTALIGSVVAYIVNIPISKIKKQ